MLYPLLSALIRVRKLPLFFQPRLARTSMPVPVVRELKAKLLDTDYADREQGICFVFLSVSSA